MSAAAATISERPAASWVGIALLIAGVAVREGLDAWRGEGCCVSSPLDDVEFKDSCEMRGRHG